MKERLNLLKVLRLKTIELQKEFEKLLHPNGSTDIEKCFASFRFELDREIAHETALEKLKEEK